MRPYGQQGVGGPKKLVVKNLRTTPKVDPQDFFNRKWKEQAAALDALFAGNGSKLMLEELYRSTEHICRQGKASELFDRLKEKCIDHLSSVVRPKLVQSCAGERIAALRDFVDAWQLWQHQLRTIRHIYFYLNQAYLIKHEHGDITQVGMQIFKSAVYQDLDISETVLAASIDLVQQSRTGNTSNGALLKDAVTTFHGLQVYTSHFEPLFVQASQEYLRSWRKEEAEKADLPHYVRSCSDLYAAEIARCSHLTLDHSTQRQLSQMFDEICVEENVERLTHEDSILDMLEADQNTELQQTWQLLSRKDQQHLLAPPWSKFVDLEGTAIVFDEKQEDTMVVRLLAFKKKLDNIHVNCFGKDEMMGNTLHKAFEVFMNKTKKSATNWDTDNAKPGEMIAKHIDLLMKGGAKALPKLAAQPENGEEEFDDNDEDGDSIEVHLANALDLFRFIHGKAVFEAFYKKDLARRLLMGRTQSFDAERSMLARLRNECGANFTHNLESMFKDMDLAREEMKAYNELLLQNDRKPPVEIAVNVLSVAAWPTYADIPVNIPTSILQSQSDFENYFKDKHVGRKLSWKPSLATCQLRARFGKVNKELVVSGFQAIVLLLFNDSNELSYEQIQGTTALPEAEVKRTLQSLACAKYKVLTKSPKGREVNDNDTFTFNEKFSDSRFRVKINQIQLKETKEENKETHQRVAADRHYETQAAIVRILKGRKRISHNELIVEVIKATRSRGVLDQADIKKNIEK